MLGKWTSRCLNKGQDSTGMGRWAWQRMRGKGDKVIMTITAYRVCQTSLAGPNTAHSQQWQMLTKQGKTEPNPRQQFLTDLECFINTRRGPPHHEQIMLSLDAN